MLLTWWPTPGTFNRGIDVRKAVIQWKVSGKREEMQVNDPFWRENTSLKNGSPTPLSGTSWQGTGQGVQLPVLSHTGTNWGAEGEKGTRGWGKTHGVSGRDGSWKQWDGKKSKRIGAKIKNGKYVEKWGWLILEHMKQFVLGSNRRGSKVGFHLVLVIFFPSSQL